MAMQDLREFLELLEKHGELTRVQEEVDWNLEIGAIIRRCYDIGAPAALFEKIKDYPQGFRALGAPMGASSRSGHSLYARTALALGLGPDTSAKEIMNYFLKRKEKPIKPSIVKSGPCKENILLGKEVDLLKFPVPLVHGGDGGRYIGTWHTVITKDQDSSWVNWGMYRLMVHDRNTMGCLFPLQQHIGQMYQKYEARNEPMPAAVAIGGQPVIPIVSCAQLPPFVNEVDIAGGLQGKPVSLVKCETVDLEVPATAEIILEGEVLPHVRGEEGPFGEFTGYAVGSRQRPVVKLKAITHRRDPVYQTISSGATEHCLMPAVAKESYVFGIAKGACPTLQNIHCAYTGRGRFHYFVSIDKQAQGQPRNMAMAIFGADLLAKQVVVVDKDIDIFDEKQVLWAIATRLQGDTDIVNIPGGLGSDLDPSNHGEGVQCKTIFDATAKPSLEKFAIRNSVPNDVLARVRQQLGLDESGP